VTLKEFINYRSNCPVCNSHLVFKSIGTPFNLKISKSQDKLYISKSAKNECILDIIIDLQTNKVNKKLKKAAFSYVNGFISRSCLLCKNYEYRSSYFEYDYLSGNFPNISVDRESYFNCKFTIHNKLLDKKTIIYSYVEDAGWPDYIEIPFISMEQLNVKDEESAIKKIIKLMIIV